MVVSGYRDIFRVCDGWCLDTYMSVRRKLAGPRNSPTRSHQRTMELGQGQRQIALISLHCRIVRNNASFVFNNRLVLETPLIELTGNSDNQSSTTILITKQSDVRNSLPQRCNCGISPRIRCTTRPWCSMRIHDTVFPLLFWSGG